MTIITEQNVKDYVNMNFCPEATNGLINLRTFYELSQNSSTRKKIFNVIFSG